MADPTPTSRDALRDLVLRFADAFNRGDLDEVMRCCCLGRGVR